MFGLFPPERSASLTTQWVPYTASTEPFSCWAWEVIGSHAGPRRLLESRGRWRLCFPALPCRPPAHLRPPLSSAPSRAAGTTPPRRPWGLLSGLLALSPSPLLAHCDAGGERALQAPYWPLPVAFFSVFRLLTFRFHFEEASPRLPLPLGSRLRLVPEFCSLFLLTAPLPKAWALWRPDPSAPSQPRASGAGRAGKEVGLEGRLKPEAGFPVVWGHFFLFCWCHTHRHPPTPADTHFGWAPTQICSGETRRGAVRVVRLELRRPESRSLSLYFTVSAGQGTARGALLGWAEGCFPPQLRPSRVRQAVRDTPRLRLPTPTSFPCVLVTISIEKALSQVCTQVLRGRY